MNRIVLDNLKPFDNWRRAPLGALLKVRSGTEPDIIGMRCEMPVGSMPVYYLLALTGKTRGMLLESGMLREPALDVSSLFDVVVDNPFPVELTEQHSNTHGIVCGSGLGSGFLFVRAMLSSQKQAYVILRDPRKDHTAAGTVFDKEPPEGWVLGYVDVSEKIDTFGSRVRC